MSSLYERLREMLYELRSQGSPDRLPITEVLRQADQAFSHSLALPDDAQVKNIVRRVVRSKPAWSTFLGPLLPPTASLSQVRAALAGSAEELKACEHLGVAIGAAMKVLGATGLALDGHVVRDVVQEIRDVLRKPEAAS